LTVTDPQGATDTSTIVLTIANVAPTITTNATPTATEGTQWTYPAAASDPGSDTITWTLSGSAPAGMTVGALTGLVGWTPGYADVGTASFTLTADDGDGGTDVQTVTITIAFLDADGDGLADTWETDNGLDPTVDDSTLDPDADGLTNLDEFLGGTDPNVSDGPGVAVLTWPIGGEEVDDPRPGLTWDAATDPNNDTLTYEVEVYEDSSMAVLLASTSGTADLTWEVDAPLAENLDAYWRVRASDPYIAGSWSALEAFFVNEVNEAPGVPTALFPVDGETVATKTPDAQLAEAVDVDRDALGYRIRVWHEDQMVTEAWTPPGARDFSWTVDVELSEDTWYTWDAQAEDEHGLAGDWMEAEPFFVTTENAAPEDVHFVDPLDGDIVDSTSPALEATESVDPEGATVVYVFQLDTAAGFDSPDLLAGVVEHNGSGTVVFDLDAEGETLTENTTWNARVRAEDDLDIGSAWDVIEFFVRGDNDAPPTPVLISPEDGAVLGTASPIVAIGHVVDPEGDTVFYEITVARDADLTEVLGSVTGLVEGAGPEGTVDQATWQLTERVNGTFYWSARAVDELGAASEWAEAWSFSFDDSDPARPTPEEGCDCESSLVSSSSASWAAMLFLLIPALRRRRS
jgi:MYXO-CTERM domain-containing protein